MLSLVFLAPALLVCVVLYKLGRFYRNVRLAKATGLPYTFSPHLEFETVAYFTTPLLREGFASRLMQGKGWPRWARFMIKDWPYEDKFRAHQELGEVFLVVAPNGIICYSADATTAMDVCTRRKEFTKPRDKYQMIEPFGPNVVTSEGDLWRFHVRVTAPPFGELNNRLVWTETFRQTDLLAAAWAEKGSGNLKDDIYSLTLNIISAAGFGRRIDWAEDMAQAPPGYRMNFLKAITGVVTNIVAILLVPKWLLKMSPWASGYVSHREFERYMRELIATEKEKVSRDADYEGGTKGNLLTAVLKASAAEESSNLAAKAGTGKKTHFNDDEVLGNAFMFLLAGYDTTANSMIYGAVTLALHDDLQDRMIEEVDRVYDEAEREGRKELDYVRDYPKFTYIMAFMYEILRVFPIVIHMTKMVTNEQRLITTSTLRDGEKGGSDHGHVLPAGCRVYLSSTGTHYNERYWKDPHVMDPRRWLSPEPNRWDPATDAAAEIPDAITSVADMPRHTKGTFLTFSEGARACLGRKFAQVEYVAFFAGILRNHRFRLGEGVSAEHVDQVLRHRCAGAITLAPAEDVKLFLSPRA